VTTVPSPPDGASSKPDCPPQSQNGGGHEQDHDHTPNGKACGYDK
jgi:hypothetical protein